MNVLLRFFQPTILPATPRFALPRGAPDRAGSSVGLFRHAAGKAGRRGVRSGSDGPRAGLRSGRDRPLRLPPARACARRAPPRRARAPRDLPRGSPPARWGHRPAAVRRSELRDFLSCGHLAAGFVRLRCENCRKDLLVPFSCRGRGFCPSCTGRRMASLAARLAEEVLAGLPVRQWVDLW